MLYELCLTRVLSTLFYHHTAFLSLSVAMLGLGAGALALRFLRGDPDRLLTGLALAAAWSTPLLPLSFPWLQVDQDLLADFGAAALLRALGLSMIIVLLPFLFGGAGLALAFSRSGSEVARLYAADLAGAALATLLMVPVMEHLGGPASLPAAGLIIAAGAILLPGRKPVRLLALVLLAVVTLLAARSDIFKLGLELRTEDRSDALGASPEPLFEKWNAFSRVTVLENAGWDRGLSAKTMARLGGSLPEQREALIDINAFAPLVRFDGDLEKVAHLRDVVSNLGYHLLEPGAEVAIIGPGGGKDVLGALLFAPAQVVGIELNPILVNDLVKDRFREFTGDLYRRQDVKILVGEGRFELGRLDQIFDIIVANSVATWAAQGTGAMNLSEQHIFTREAFALYRDHLTAEGMLSVSLWDEAEHSLPMRLAATWMAAAKGAASSSADATLAANEIAVIGNLWEPGRWFSTVLMKKGGFKPAEKKKLAAKAKALGFDLIHLDGDRSSLAPEFAAFLADPIGSPAAEKYDLSPATDDRPFVFYTLKLADALRFWKLEGLSDNLAFAAIMVSLGLVILLVALLILPLLVLGRGQEGDGLEKREVLHFAALGLAFMFVEVALIQRLDLVLGHPTLSLTVTLFGVLLWSGVGSRLAAGLLARQNAAIIARRALVLLLFTLLATWYLAVSAVTSSFGARPLFERVAFVLLLIMPAGLGMGMPMAMGMRLVGERSAVAVSRAFGVNCAAGVLASVVAILIAVLFGFTAAFAAGVICYTIALLSSFRTGPSRLSSSTKELRP